MSDAARHSPPRVEDGNPSLSRRGLLVGGVAGAAAAYGLTASGAAARGFSPALRRALVAGTVSFGSNGSDPVPKKAYANVFKAFTKKTGIGVKVNTVDHNTFQEQINTYLQGQPQDVFTWFAGYRMQFFAQRSRSLPRPSRTPRRGRTGTTTSSRSTPTRGQSTTARACGSSTATRSRRRGISSSRSPRR